MQLTSLVAFMAAGLSVVAAQDANAITGTTSSTTTIFQTVTVTRCDPEFTNCPLSSSTSAPVVPMISTTSSITPSAMAFPAGTSNSTAGPTGTPASRFSNTTAPTRSSAGNTAPGSDSAPTSSTIATADAAGRFVRTGMMLGLVAAGVAILA